MTYSILIRNPPFVFMKLPHVAPLDHWFVGPRTVSRFSYDLILEPEQEGMRNVLSVVLSYGSPPVLVLDRANQSGAFHFAK